MKPEFLDTISLLETRDKRPIIKAELRVDKLVGHTNKRRQNQEERLQKEILRKAKDTVLYCARPCIGLVEAVTKAR